MCGLNGCGKSTLGRALAQKIGFHFIDNEELFFTRNAADEPYQNPRSRAEVEKLLMEEVRKHGDFVLAAVRGDYGKEILPLYRYTVLMEVPKEIRMERIRNRSFQIFGSRMRKFTCSRLLLNICIWRSAISKSLSCVCSGKDCEAVGSSFMAELIHFCGVPK